MGSTTTPHSNPVTDVATLIFAVKSGAAWTIIPNDKYLLTCFDQGALQVHDPETGALLKYIDFYKANAWWRQPIAASHDSRMIAVLNRFSSEVPQTTASPSGGGQHQHVTTGSHHQLQLTVIGTPWSDAHPWTVVGNIPILDRNQNPSDLFRGTPRSLAASEDDRHIAIGTDQGYILFFKFDDYAKKSWTKENVALQQVCQIGGEDLSGGVYTMQFAKSRHHPRQTHQRRWHDDDDDDDDDDKSGSNDKKNAAKSPLLYFGCYNAVGIASLSELVSSAERAATTTTTTPTRTVPTITTALLKHPHRMGNIVNMHVFRDGRRIATAADSNDNTVLIHDVGNPARPVQLARIDTVSDIFNMTVSPQDETLLSINFGREVRIWWIGGTAQVAADSAGAVVGSAPPLPVSKQPRLLLSNFVDIRTGGDSSDDNIPAFGKQAVVSGMFSERQRNIFYTGGDDRVLRVWQLPPWAFHARKVVFLLRDQTKCKGRISEAFQIWNVLVNTALFLPIEY